MQRQNRKYTTKLNYFLQRQPTSVHYKFKQSNNKCVYVCRAAREIYLIASLQSFFSQKLIMLVFAYSLSSFYMSPLPCMYIANKRESARAREKHFARTRSKTKKHTYIECIKCETTYLTS